MKIKGISTNAYIPWAILGWALTIYLIWDPRLGHIHVPLDARGMGLTLLPQLILFIPTLLRAKHAGWNAAWAALIFVPIFGIVLTLPICRATKK